MQLVFEVHETELKEPLVAPAGSEVAWTVQALAAGLTPAGEPTAALAAAGDAIPRAATAAIHVKPRHMIHSSPSPARPVPNRLTPSKTPSPLQTFTNSSHIFPALRAGAL
jgi:hypothetical protein